MKLITVCSLLVAFTSSAVAGITPAKSGSPGKINCGLNRDDQVYSAGTGIKFEEKNRAKVAK